MPKSTAVYTDGFTDGGLSFMAWRINIVDEWRSPLMAIIYSAWDIAIECDKLKNNMAFDGPM